MKIIIAGGRDFFDVNFIESHLEEFFSSVKDKSKIEIVSGIAIGVDCISAKWAFENGFNVKEFPYAAQYGKSGGPIRNRQMAEYSKGGGLIAFWNGTIKNSGTYNMITTAKEYNLKIKIIKY